MHAATGEVIAYIDDDAWPDPDWLRHVVTTLERGFQAVGGPNLPPEEDEGLVAQAVADAPGGPVHVLLSDREAEHIPGCNMAFRRDALLAVDGFDPRFRIAGDDVDLCWRLHERRAAVGFSPGAVVWHLRRGSVRGYLRQQHQYGRAEALLERKWPERYNATGHLTWCGHVYTGGRSRSPWRRWRLYYGRWASEPFPDGGVAPPSLVATLPALPEWYLVIGALAALSLLGIEWRPLLAAVPLLALAVTATVAVAALSPVPTVDRRGRRRALVHRSLVTLLRVLQPAARLIGRLRLGLAPWRGHVTTSRAWPLPATGAIWSERWASQQERLARLQEHLRRDGAVVRAGGGWDRWDLEVRGGVLGAMRLRVGVEEHGEGRQLVRLRSWPRMSAAVIALAVALVALCAGAALSGAPVATVVLATSATALLTGGVLHCTTASGIIRAGLGAEREHSARPRLSVAATRSGGGDGNGRVGHPISTNGATAVRRADAGDRREGEVLS
jgi:hypothetical protein